MARISIPWLSGLRDDRNGYEVCTHRSRVDCYLGELARFTIHGSPWSRSSFEIMRRFWLTSIMGVSMCQDTYLNSGPFFWGRQRVYRKRSPSYGFPPWMQIISLRETPWAHEPPGFPPHAPSTKDCDAYVKDIATALEAIRTFSEHAWSNFTLNFLNINMVNHGKSW